MRSKLSNVKIRLADSREDREKLFRFRYEIYVEEMRREQKYADNRSRTIEEPFDATGANFIALEGDKVIGCIRSNCGTNTRFGEYVDLYDMTCVGPYFPRYCNVNTNLMVSADHRRSGIMLMLACEASAYVRRQGMVCEFIDCNRHLEKQFLRFGYRQYRNRIQHPERGDVLPLLLLGVDSHYLSRCRSPLAPIERQLERDLEAVRYFKDNVFRKMDSRISPQLQQPPYIPEPHFAAVQPFTIKA